MTPGWCAQAELRQRYAALEQQKRPNQKADLQAGTDLHKERGSAKLYGHVRGVPPGTVFSGRGELLAVGVHTNYYAGIDWITNQVRTRTGELPAPRVYRV